MTDEATFLFLGTGAATGTPMLGCPCNVCSSENPRDMRLRPSGLLTLAGKHILIDTSPDFRQQALHHNITDLDAVIYTHTHYDHIAGIDELRAYYFLGKERLPCYVSNESFEDIQRRYYYLFRPPSDNHNTTAQLDFKVLAEKRGNFDCESIPIHYFTYTQGAFSVTGLRIYDFAYVTDIKEYPSTIFDDLRGVKTLVISAPQHDASHVHFGLEDALAFARSVKAERTYITHISHRIDYASCMKELPKDIHLSYDGLQIKL
jgi:phosphoribosyl 1,2-cyclic phosphate phosphodiesterase